MNRPVVAALTGKPTDRTPIWIMRQAGRHLPEYRRLREGISFQDAVGRPEVAAEITLQPVRRYGMDGAVIFADIMTPLEAMGVDITFDPGPRLRPHELAEVVRLPLLSPDRLSFVSETIARVRAEIPDDTTVIGFAGAPFTLLCYLIEGGGSKDFMAPRAALHRDLEEAEAALDLLAHNMNAYLRMQAEAGADVVQLFDSWAGVVDRRVFERLVAPAARKALADLPVPTIYFAPHASHTLDLQTAVAADGYGVDWRLPLDEAWDRLGSGAIQGNLDPAVLLTDPGSVARAAGEILASVAGRAGHIFNLGHGIHPSTPPENVAALVEAVRR